MKEALPSFRIRRPLSAFRETKPQHDIEILITGLRRDRQDPVRAAQWIGELVFAIGENDLEPEDVAHRVPEEHQLQLLDGCGVLLLTYCGRRRAAFPDVVLLVNIIVEDTRNGTAVDAALTDLAVQAAAHGLDVNEVASKLPAQHRVAFVREHASFA